MTPQQIEAMKLALEALYPIAHNTTDDPRGQAYKAITALEEVLAQPEQEPVIDKSAAIRIATSLGWTPKRKPLSDEEISNLWDGHVVPVFGKNGINPIVFARAIEAAHNIKENT